MLMVNFNINSIRTFPALWFKGKKRKFKQNKFTVGMFKTNDFQIGRARPIANIFCTETIRTQTTDLASSM